MNIIEKIKQQIDEANELLKEHESVLISDPNNFAYKLSLTSIQEHIYDLQIQLQKEKALRDKEVLEIRLRGFLAEKGSIPLHLLSSLATHLSQALLTASQKIKHGVSVRGRVPNEIINTLDLRLAGISCGSTRLFVTGNTAPDIFGFSLLENSLENAFELLTSETPEKLSESASRIGIRSVHRLSNFLKALSTSGLEVDLKWISPTQKKYEWNADKEIILRLSNSMDSLRSLEPEPFAYVGKLIMVSLKGQIEIEQEDGKVIKGTFPSGVLEDIKKLHIGDKSSGLAEQLTIINQATGYEKSYYTIKSISKYLDGSDNNIEIPFERQKP